MPNQETPNNSPRRRSTRRAALRLDQSGGANPADASGVNINTIMAQYARHGTLPTVARTNPLYGDFTFGEDIHEIREAVYEAESRFNNLPADVRTAAKNDWVTFYDMFNNPEDQAKLVAAGLQISDLPQTTQSTPPLTTVTTANPTTPANSTTDPTSTPNEDPT